MADKKRGLSGHQAAAEVGTGTAAGRDNAKEARHWVSHRGGPFLVHDNEGACEPQPNDNAGYLDDYGVAIEQGFAPCPKCGGAA